MAFMLYRSSAGSGKTYTLVKEYLKLVLENPGKFKHILAITFTNKAAGEMKERILLALKKLAKGEDKFLEETLKQEMPHLRNIDALSSQILTQLLHHYSDFAIMTIDSFIHRVIKAFALEIGLPLNFGIDLNYEKIRTYVVEKLLDSVGKDKYITDVILEFVFARVREEKTWNIEGDIRRFENELFKERNIDWIKAIRSLREDQLRNFRVQLEALRDNFINEVRRLGQQAAEAITGAGLTVDDFAYKKSGAAGFLSKCARARPGDIKELTLSSRLVNGQWYSKSAAAGVKAAIENLLTGGLANIRLEIMACFETPRREALTAAFILDNIYLAAIINRMTALIGEYKQKNNMIPISEFNVQVYEIVKNSPVPFIYAILGEKYNHYLLDEFQDTSRLQWENLFPLIENSLGSGFLSMAVGDGKQSIYRWRGGDMEIMEADVECKILAEELAIKRLGRNFRSRQKVVDFNNRFFEAVDRFHQQGNSLLAGIYSDVVQDACSKAGGYVSLRFLEDMDGDDDFLITGQVKDICLSCGYEWGDIAVLVRENKQGQRLADYLLENDIPVVSPESLIISRVPLIRFLVDILGYLVNPADKIAEAAIIFFLGLNKSQSPLDPGAVGGYFMEHKQWLLSEEINEFFQRRAYFIRMPVYEVIEEVIRVFKLDRSLDFAAAGYLQAFLDVVSAYTAENSVDVASFLEWWELSKGEFTVTVPETKPAVKIMTIHKAKGLEFPVVIVPYADWEHKQDKQLWLKADPLLPMEPPLDMPMPVNSGAKLEETYFRSEYEREKEKVTIDNINLLYVAFTRAVDHLYVISRRREKNENYRLLNDLAAPFMEAGDSGAGWSVFTFGEPGAAEQAKPPVREIRYTAEAELISQKWYDRITIRRKSREFWRFDADYRSKQRSGGILIHQVLSNIRLPGDVDAALDNARAAGDIDDGDRKDLEKKIREIFEIEEVKEWFRPGLEVFREFSIITDDGVLRPDRVVIDGDAVTVIDFKTGEAKDQDVLQMNEYKEAVRGMGYKNVEGYLFYLENKAVINAPGPAERAADKDARSGLKHIFQSTNALILPPVR